MMKKKQADEASQQGDGSDVLYGNGGSAPFFYGRLASFLLTDTG